MSQVILAEVTGSATGAQTAVTAQHSFAGKGLRQERPTGLFQVAISATATVLLQGRLNASLAWVTLATYTADALVEVVLAPQMRVNISANSGDVDAQLEY